MHNLDGLGYSDATTIWRAAMGSMSGEFESSPPAGLSLLETHGALRRLIVAMDALTEDEDTKRPVVAVQWLYLWGAERAMGQWGGSKTKFYEAIRTGELLIRREMKR